MLSVKECREYLKGDYTDQEVEEIRENLTALASIAIHNYSIKSRSTKDRSPDHRSL